MSSIRPPRASFAATDLATASFTAASFAAAGLATGIVRSERGVWHFRAAASRLHPTQQQKPAMMHFPYLARQPAGLVHQRQRRIHRAATVGLRGLRESVHDASNIPAAKQVSAREYT